MKRRMLVGLGLMTALGFVSTLSHERRADAHCQIPCGIYDDAARIQRMLEDTQTIQKAMTKINEMAGQGEALSINQVTRWIHVKEQHASNIITIVSEYFLTQKIKDIGPGEEGYEDYLQKLADHHKVMRAAMVTKQTVDPANAENLHQAIDTIAKYWVKRPGS